MAKLKTAKAKKTKKPRRKAEHKHRLVVIGDSMSQGFMSGAIFRTDICYPVWVADALGIRGAFRVPDFEGQGGLPLNLERVLSELSERYGPKINWWELVPMIARLQAMLDGIEDYWERGKGSWPYPQRAVHHNLAVWGFEVRDAYTVTEGVCRRTIPKPKDDLLKQTPEMAMYRTARRVLNPTFANDAMEWHQVRAARELAADGGIENLVLFLGANNALGTVTSLSIKYSEPPDLHRLPHERTCNLYLPDHFQQLYQELATEVDRIGAERVFVGTVPSVTIPPVTRGVSPNNTLDQGYFEFYTRPWIWDDVFDKDKHPHLTRDQAKTIDEFIGQYNETIRRIAGERKNWYVFDTAETLNELAFRRRQGDVAYEFPAGLVQALKDSNDLRYLVDEDDKVLLDTRFFRVDSHGRVERGGLFSLDGIHPTTIGYGLLADVLVKAMKEAHVDFPGNGELDWKAIVAADTLVNRPPLLLRNLRDCLTFLDKRALLSSILELFS